MLWVVAATLWGGVRLVGIKANPWPPSFWVNALMTMWILLGPAIEDASVGKDVGSASATRVCLVHRRLAVCVGDGVGARALARLHGSARSPLSQSPVAPRLPAS